MKTCKDCKHYFNSFKDDAYCFRHGADQNADKIYTIYNDDECLNYQDKPPKPIDTEFTREVICPYCGYEHQDSWELDDDFEFQCHRCEKLICGERIKTIEYTTWIKEV